MGEIEKFIQVMHILWFTKIDWFKLPRWVIDLYNTGRLYMFTASINVFDARDSVWHYGGTDDYLVSLDNGHFGIQRELEFHRIK